MSVKPLDIPVSTDDPIHRERFYLAKNHREIDQPLMLRRGKNAKNHDNENSWTATEGQWSIGVISFSSPQFLSKTKYRSRWEEETVRGIVDLENVQREREGRKKDEFSPEMKLR